MGDESLQSSKTHPHCKVFSRIQCAKGDREILPKAKQNIMEFKTPPQKRETRKFVGLLGFWRQYVPHLGQILSPLYKETRKKHEFQWALQEQQVFDATKSQYSVLCTYAQYNLATHNYMFL